MSKGMQAVLALCLLGGGVLAQQADLVLTDPPANVVAPAAVIATTSEVAADDSTRLWGSLEYLIWWTSRPHVPALVTAGDPLDPTQDTSQRAMARAVPRHGPNGRVA